MTHEFAAYIEWSRRHAAELYPKALCTCAHCAVLAGRAMSNLSYGWGWFLTGTIEPLHTVFSSPTRIAA